jgi:hypothetical protein
LLRPRGPADLVTAFERLQRAAFAPEAIRAEFQPSPLDARMADVACWVGDGLGGGDWRAFLGKGRRQLLLHALSSLELGIDWIAGDTSYFDEGLGRGARQEYQGDALRHRENYVTHLGAWRTRLAAELTGAGGGYLVVSDRTAIADYQAGLAAFIAGAAVGAPASS